jgi:hypothetical protein
MAESNDFDVIVIGSGAGGVTPAHPPRLVRKARSAGRARELPAARAGQLPLDGGLRQGEVSGPGIRLDTPVTFRASER